MKQIRRSVFETNSSSSHSISMTSRADNFVNPKTEYIYDTAEFGEYGWENEWYGSVNGKLNYVFTMIQYHIKHPKYTAEFSYEEKVIDRVFNSSYFKWLKELFLDYVGRELIVNKPVYVEGSFSYPLGYIDHQSTDILDEWWADDEKTFKENMKDLIFNNRYAIVTGNDNG